MSDFPGKFVGIFPPCDTLVFLWQRFFSIFRKNVEFVFFNEIDCKKILKLFSMNSAVKTLEFFWNSLKLTIKDFQIFFTTAFIEKKFRKFFTTEFIEKNFENFLLNSLKKFRNFLIVNFRLLKKKFEKLFTVNFIGQKISKFFRKIWKKKFFLPQKKGGEIPTIFPGKSDMTFRWVFDIFLLASVNIDLTDPPYLTAPPLFRRRLKKFSKFFL